MTKTQRKSALSPRPDFEFSGKPRIFPIVDALRLMWPLSASAASELVEEWKERAGAALGKLRLSKDTMLCIASHTSRKTGVCNLSNLALSARSGRKLDATKKDIMRLKKMGYLIAEIDIGNGYRNRSRSLILAIPDLIDDDKRIPSNDDKRIPRADDHACGYSHLMRQAIEPRHVAILIAMDQVYLETVYKKQPTTPEGVKVLPPVSKAPLTAGLFDAQFGGR